MAKWIVEMYQAVPVTVEVEADTPEQAGAIGEEMILNGMGSINNEQIAYHPDKTVFTENWELPDDLF
jgi:hypothetical protein